MSHLNRKIFKCFPQKGLARMSTLKYHKFSDEEALTIFFLFWAGDTPHFTFSAPRLGSRLRRSTLPFPTLTLIFACVRNTLSLTLQGGVEPAFRDTTVPANLRSSSAELLFMMWFSVLSVDFHFCACRRYFNRVYPAVRA